MISMIVYHNAVQDWLIAFGLTAVFFAAALIARGILFRRLSALAKRRNAAWFGLPAELIERVHAIFLLTFAAYAASLRLALPVSTGKIVWHAVFVVLLVQSALLCSHAVNYWVGRYSREKMASDAGTVTTLISVGFVLRMVNWIIFLLIGLDNFGVDITALVAGLGITGIAVALAIQNILGDLFASFSIVLDKPFLIGDFIAIDGYMGAVEHIGLKTTRIRSLSGEQLIFANADLLKCRIRNYRRMEERRVVFSFRVVYRTPVDKLRLIPALIREAVEKNSQVRFDRAHFAELGDFALRFETVYYVLTPDYNRFMDIQQAINLDIHSRLEEAGIAFAYPAQAVAAA